MLALQNAATSKATDDRGLCTINSPASAEHLITSKDPLELRRYLRLAHITSKAMLDISRARCPHEILMRLSICCKQIWSICDLHVRLGLCEILAPKEPAAQLLTPKSVQEPSCRSRIYPVAATELDPVRYLLPPKGAQELLSSGRPSPDDATEACKDLEKQFHWFDLTPATHRGAMEQCQFVRHVPLTIQGEQLGVLCLGTRALENFRAVELATFTAIAEAASAHLRALRKRQEMECRCRATLRDCARHRQAAAACRRLLDEMLPSHVVDRLCQVYGPQVGDRCEPEPEEAPVADLRQEDSHSKLNHPLPEDGLSEHQPLRDNVVSERLQPEADNRCVKVSGHNKVWSRPVVKTGKQSLQACSISASISSQLDNLAHAESHECVAILFSDIKGFTNLSSTANPAAVMVMLDNLFSRFDAIVENHTPAAYKVETIGDGYMIAFGVLGQTGFPEQTPTDYAVAMRAITVGAEMVRAAQLVLDPLGDPIKIRVGVQLGRIMSGIIGRKVPRYCMFGSTVNMASRMESSGVPGKIHVTECMRRACRHGREGRALAFHRIDGQLVHGKTFLLEPEQVLGVGLRPRLGPAKHTACTRPGKDSGGADLSPSCKELGREWKEARGDAALPKLLPVAQAATTRLWEEGHLRATDCLVSMMRGPAPEDPLELRRHLRLALITSKVTMGIFRAQCPGEIFMQLWTCCEQIWSTCNVQVRVGLCELLAPKELARHQPAPMDPLDLSSRDRATTEGSNNLDDKLFCLDLTPATLVADEAEEGRCQWFGVGAGARASNWQRLDLRQYPALRHCFKEAEEVEDALGSNGWGLPEHSGTTGQCESILYVPLTIEGRPLGALRLGKCSPGGFGAAERTSFALVVETAAAHLQALHRRYEMECRCQAAEVDCAPHKEAAATYRKVLHSMLPSHVVDELCKVCRHRRAQEAEEDPGQEDASSDLEDPLPEENLKVHLPIGDGSFRKGQPELSIEHISPPVKRGQRNLQSGSIPASVSAQLDNLTYAEEHESVAILFADIKGFDNVTEAAQPAEVMVMLDDLFSRFDAIIDKHEPAAYKVETIGDVYMVAFGLFGQTGLSEEKPTDCALAMHAVTLGAEMVQAAQLVVAPSGGPIEIRVGLHIGRITSGIIGRKGLRYCMFGDTVNTASRMMSSGVPGKVHVTEGMQRACRQGDQGRALAFCSTGGQQLKGKGWMETFLLEPAQVLHVGFQPQPEIFDHTGCASPCKGSDGADCSPSCKEPWPRQDGAREEAALSQLPSMGRAATTKLREGGRLHTTDCPVSTMHLAAPEDPFDLRRPLHLTLATSKVIGCMSRAQCLREIFPQLSALSKQIWSTCKAQVSVALRELAPKERVRHRLVPTAAQEPSGRSRLSMLEDENLGETLFCLDLTPAALAAGEAKGGCCQLDSFNYVERHGSVVIRFSDIKGFATLTEAAHHVDFIAMLNDLFGNFDALSQRLKLATSKVETTGGVCMVAFVPFGKRVLSEDTPADYALAMHAIAAGAKVVGAVQPVLARSGEPVKIRVGTHVGQILSGVIRKEVPRYCMLGATVNIASCMVSSQMPGNVQDVDCMLRVCREKRQGQALAFCSISSQQLKGRDGMETFVPEPQQVLEVGFRLQLDGVEYVKSAAPCKDSGYADCNQICKHLQCAAGEEVRRGSALPKSASVEQTPGAKLWTGELLRAISHAVAELCEPRSPRGEPAPEESPEARTWREEARFELGEPLPEDSFDDRLLLGESNAGERLPLETGSACVRVRGDCDGKDRSSPHAKRDNRSPQSHAIPDGISTQTDELTSAERQQSVAILFSDIEGFTNLSQAADSAEVMVMPDDLFDHFASIVEGHMLAADDVETTGDAPMMAFALSGQTGLLEEMSAEDPCELGQYRCLGMFWTRRAEEILMQLGASPQQNGRAGTIQVQLGASPKQNRRACTIQVRAGLPVILAPKDLTRHLLVPTCAQEHSGKSRAPPGMATEAGKELARRRRSTEGTGDLLHAATETGELARDLPSPTYAKEPSCKDGSFALVTEVAAVHPQARHRGHKMELQAAETGLRRQRETATAYCKPLSCMLLSRAMDELCEIDSPHHGHCCEPDPEESPEACQRREDASFELDEPLLEENLNEHLVPEDSNVSEGLQLAASSECIKVLLGRSIEACGSSRMKTGKRSLQSCSDQTNVFV